ncbi:MAG TPA: FAD-dependent monooxygenase [Candidatus Tectomicrobia bacterium]|nr:FAD-dependent monooxygenase [Candidatus Tectomicrobia bacterium]
MTVPVVVAGAGPVGLALACALGHHGVACVVLEEDDGLSRHSKAPGILPRTLEVFRAWGVLDAAIAAGTMLTRPSVWSPDAREPLLTIDLGPLDEMTAAPGLLVLPQNRTEAVLRDHVVVHGLAELRFGHRVAGFEQGEAGVAVLVEPATGTPYRIEAEFLVGCDGAHSVVRDTLGWRLEGTTYPTRLVLADVRLNGGRNALPWPRLAADGDAFHAAGRLEPDLWRIIGNVAPDITDEEAASPRGLEPRVSRLFGPGAFELVWADTFRIHCRTSPGFRRGRVLLAGDAAHVNSPAGGQGMNSGIQDAHNLGWKVARALAGGAQEALLASYEEERRAVIVGNVDRYTDLLTRAFLLAPPLVRRATLTGLRLALRQPAVWRRLLRRAAMLDARYPRSSLICGDGRWLGARAEDAPVLLPDGSRGRLLDLAARDAALLLFQDATLPAWNAAEVETVVGPIPGLRVWRLRQDAGTAPGPSDVVDVTGALWRRWRPRPGSAALVRPDGHVGWAGQRPSAEVLRDGVRRALGAR